MVALLGYGAAVLLCAVLAGLFGTARERMGVLVVAGLGVAWALGGASPRPHAAAWICMTLDLAALVWLARIAWKAPRSWPVWALAPQAVAVAAGVAFLLQPDVSAAIYFRALLMTHCGLLLALAIGTGAQRSAHS